MDRLLIIDWDIPTVIISDRDPNFFFGNMGIKLFIFTVYYNRTDKVSKRINPTIKNYLIFHDQLSRNQFHINIFFQTQFNNSFNAIIGLSANELNYGFKIREKISKFITPITFDLLI